MAIKGTIITIWTLAAVLIAVVAVDMGRTWWSAANYASYPACPAPVEGVACG